MVSVLFHLPHRDAFHLSLTVLVRYRSEIIFSLGRVVLPDSDRISLVPPYLRIIASGVNDFRIRGYYPLWLFFPKDFTNDSHLTPVNRVQLPRNPTSRRMGLDFSPFARHYLGNHILFSIPPGTKMFQFPGFASWTYEFSSRFPVKTGRVAPFGDPRIKACLTAPRGLSQPAASFIAYFSQGIHHIR